MLQFFPTVISYTHTQCRSHCVQPVEGGLHIHSQRRAPAGPCSAESYAGCWGLTFMCWGCPNRPIRCFCFLCSVIYKTQKRYFQKSSHLYLCWRARPLLLNMPAASLHRFALSYHFEETTKRCTNSAHCWTERRLKSCQPRHSHCSVFWRRQQNTNH